MTDIEQQLEKLGSLERVRPRGLVPILKRAPNSIRWRVINASRLVKREATGLVHSLQGRRLVHLFHFGKTGGTAFKEALTGHERDGNRELVLHGHALYLHQIPWNEEFALVVRDPISRFSSGFYSRLRQEQPRYFGPWVPGEEEAFRRFPTPNRLALALSSRDPEEQAAAVQAMRTIQHIESPQWKWLGGPRAMLKRRSKILFIGFQETLSEDFELFKRILELPAHLQLPTDEVRAHRNPETVDRKLDEEAKRNLRAWYKKDYEFLEICKEVAAEIRARYPAPSPSRQVTEATGPAAQAGKAHPAAAEVGSLCLTQEP